MPHHNSFLLIKGLCYSSDETSSLQFKSFQQHIYFICYLSKKNPKYAYLKNYSIYNFTFASYSFTFDCKNWVKYLMIRWNLNLINSFYHEWYLHLSYLCRLKLFKSIFIFFIGKLSWLQCFYCFLLASGFFIGYSLVINMLIVVDGD